MERKTPQNPQTNTNPPPPFKPKQKVAFLWVLGNVCSTRCHTSTPRIIIRITINYLLFQNLGVPGIHPQLSGHRQHAGDCTKFKFFKIQAWTFKQQLAKITQRESRVSLDSHSCRSHQWHPNRTEMKMKWKLNHVRSLETIPSFLSRRRKMQLADSCPVTNVL